jgi:DNA-binding HxlR family transcriptional regulator
MSTAATAAQADDATGARADDENAGADVWDRLTFDVLAKRCPSRPVLEHVTGRWGTLVLIAVREGPTRFNELRRRVDGVSEKMLAQSLHALERDGFVERTVHSTIPPRVEYALTPLGTQTTDKLRELVEVLENAMPQILEAQSGYDDDPAA